MRLSALFAAMGLSWALAFAGPAVALPSSQGPLTVTATVTGLDEPWGFAFLPEGGVLITERSGTLIHVAPDGTRSTVTGTPRVADAGQGGLLDILLPRDFAQTREVYLTFAARQRGGAGTALARATLSADAARLEGTEVIWELASGSSGGRHFGSRVVEGADGFLYVTIGDRGDRPSAQDLSNENGSVVRVARDGSIPASNPDLGQGARPGIYSYGHRNPQGAAVDAQGRIWVVEHGAAGGDEVNLVEAGANYGWPTISYGRHYSGAKIGVGTSAPGLKQPMHYWDPSIAPSGMMIYSGKLWPSWEGDIFVGSLKFDMISRLERGTMVREIERLSSDETLRVRDIREAPDGTIWFLSVGQGALYRISL